jgi:hypothetical protein
MPQGYYSIEQWKRPRKQRAGTWTPVLQLPFGATLTEAEEILKQLGNPGFYRIVQMQRVIWAEAGAAGLNLRKSHASSPENLDQMRAMFERCAGRYPHEEVRAACRLAKARRSS